MGCELLPSLCKTSSHVPSIIPYFCSSSPFFVRPFFPSFFLPSPPYRLSAYGSTDLRSLSRERKWKAEREREEQEKRAASNPAETRAGGERVFALSLSFFVSFRLASLLSLLPVIDPLQNCHPSSVTSPRTPHFSARIPSRRPRRPALRSPL